MSRIKINTRNHTKEKPYLINSFFFSKIGKAKKVFRVGKIHCYMLSHNRGNPLVLTSVLFIANWLLYKGSRFGQGYQLISAAYQLPFTWCLQGGTEGSQLIAVIMASFYQHSLYIFALLICWLHQVLVCARTLRSVIDLHTMKAALIRKTKKMQKSN